MASRFRPADRGLFFILCLYFLCFYTIILNFLFKVM